MPTLHIEHPITNFETWSSAFARFADARAQAGVISDRVQRPIDDPNFVVIDLEFETNEQAQTFLHLLKTKIWSNTENAPALAGDPQTKILQPTS